MVATPESKSINDNRKSLVFDRDRGYIQPDEYSLSDIFRRVAKAVAAPEEAYDPQWQQNFEDKIHQMMMLGFFLPNSPTIMNAGVPVPEGRKSKCLSACFVDSPEDNLESITRIGYEIPFIESAGGGVGWGLSKLRPKGDKIYDKNGACGPVAVLKWYAQAGRTFTQGAARPGAHMAQLSISHPDIREFIHVKDDCLSPDDPLANVNISVQIPDSFMFAVENKKLWSLVNPRNGEVVSQVNAQKLWEEICESAWQTGDPGVVFIDRVQETNPDKELYGDINSSNPCGEQFLPDRGSCNLGSLNLSMYVNVPKINGVRDLGRFPEFNQDLLKEHIRISVRFLDNVVEINSFPFPEFREVNLNTRRIGLGVMGLADTLALMEIPYNSEKALQFCRDLSNFINREAHTASLNLGQEKGELREGHPARNSAVTTIAPTGSISIIAGCSSGIEPYFSLFGKRKALWSADGKKHKVDMLEMPAPLRIRLENIGIDLDDIGDDLAGMSARAQRAWVVDHLGEDIAAYFPTAHDISPSEHIQMQAAWQENIDNGISKTINVAHDAAIDSVIAVYREAFDLNCKSITVYRDGSKSEQVLTTGDAAASSGQQVPQAASTGGTGERGGHQGATDRGMPAVVTGGRPKERAKTLPGVTTTVDTGHGHAYITVNNDPEIGGPIEVFITTDDNDPCNRAATVAVSKMISLSLRSGVDMKVLANGLRGLDCGHAHWSDGVLVRSIWDALAILLLDGTPDEGGDRLRWGQQDAVVELNDTVTMNGQYLNGHSPNGVVQLKNAPCVKCGSKLIHIDGCTRCSGCGAGNCG